MRSLIQQQLDNLQEEKTLLMQERDDWKSVALWLWRTHENQFKVHMQGNHWRTLCSGLDDEELKEIHVDLGGKAEFIEIGGGNE